jgi:eukaryotic-like serine/threonine-protein kinase
MGVVWRGRDELLSRDVAVKELVCPAYYSAEEEQAACRRATKEARVAARLNHPNAIRVFDIVEDAGYPWLVMELLPYGSLGDLLKQEGPLSPAQAAEVGLGILAALRAAHDVGIVHRDVKPANILLAPDRAVLTDFGIAQATGPSADTTAGLLVGSPSYIAPERARGGHCGPPADLWGLGATLYAAVEGHGPFDRPGDALVSMTAVVADEPKPAAHAGPLLWPVISGLLCKDPDGRLDAAATELMLRRVCTAAAGALIPRPRRSRSVAALIGSATLVAISAVATLLGLALVASSQHGSAQAAVAPPPAASAGHAAAPAAPQTANAR